MRLVVIALALLLAFPAHAQAAFQCLIAAGASIVSDPIGPQYGTTSPLVPPTYRLFDNGTQIASGPMVQSSTITQGTPSCFPVETPYNPGAAGSWAFRAGTGALVLGSTHNYTAIMTNNLVSPPLDGPVTPVLTVTVVAVLPSAPPGPPLSVRN